MRRAARPPGGAPPDYPQGLAHLLDKSGRCGRPNEHAPGICPRGGKQRRFPLQWPYPKRPADRAGAASMDYGYEDEVALCSMTAPADRQTGREGDADPATGPGWSQPKFASGGVRSDFSLTLTRHRHLAAAPTQRTHSLFAEHPGQASPCLALAGRLRCGRQTVGSVLIESPVIARARPKGAALLSLCGMALSSMPPGTERAPRGTGFVIEKATTGHKIAYLGKARAS